MDRGLEFKGEESMPESEYDVVNYEIAELVLSTPNLDSATLIRDELKRRGLSGLDTEERIRDIQAVAWDIKMKPKQRRDYGSPGLRKSDVEPGTGYGDRQIPTGDR